MCCYKYIDSRKADKAGCYTFPGYHIWPLTSALISAYICSHHCQASLSVTNYLVFHYGLPHSAGVVTDYKKKLMEDHIMLTQTSRGSESESTESWPPNNVSDGENRFVP